MFLRPSPFSILAYSKTGKGVVNIKIAEILENQSVVILPPMPMDESVQVLLDQMVYPVTTILDPWYNKGIGTVLPEEEYDKFIHQCIQQAAALSAFIYLWGFPEVIGPYVRLVPPGYSVTAWLTWYYKNCPSVIRGWRSSQQACIQFQRNHTSVYPEHFLSEDAKKKQEEKKARFIPGPTSVIEAPLLCGFVGKKEQCGHPAQKPIAVFEKLILMSSQPDEIIFDPMAGSGTTAAAALATGRKAIVCDENPEYIEMMENRLGCKRISL